MMHPPRTRTNTTPSSGPWENSPPRPPTIRNLTVNRHDLVDRVRLLLLRQKRAYNRRLKLFQQQRRIQNFELTENSQEMQLTMDLPGVHPSDIAVQIDTTSRILSISAKRLYKSLNDVTCRRTHDICQQYRIHSNVILQIKATLQNGVLTISAPKANVQEKDEASNITSSSQGMERNPIIIVPILSS